MASVDQGGKPARSRRPPWPATSAGAQALWALKKAKVTPDGLCPHVVGESLVDPGDASSDAPGRQPLAAGKKKASEDRCSGDPAYAVPQALDALVRPGHELVAVSEPARPPPGRASAFLPSVCKHAALEAPACRCSTPQRIRREASCKVQTGCPWRRYSVVVAFGRFCPSRASTSRPWAAERPRLRCCPRWRGAAPISGGAC